MGPISAEMPIDVPRERAYEYLADLANRPSFMGRFLSDFRLQRLDSTGVGATARFRVRQRGLWMETVITELEPHFRILESGSGSRLGRMPIGTAWETTETGPGSALVRVLHWTEPTHSLDRVAELAPGMNRWYRRALTGALAELKVQLEEEAPVERMAVGGGDRVPGAG